jgi:type IV pilus assembly protein PilV
MKPTHCHPRHQGGALLIEVLVAMLLLSFGMLSLGAMLSFALQMPKLSGHRSLAVNLASSHIDRIRANPGGFENYKKPLRERAWSFEEIEFINCQYPDCDATSLAAMDDAATRRAVRIALPAGDLIVTCDTTPCNEASHGNLWIVWQEPSTKAAIDASSSDNCPDQAKAIYTRPPPRCLYVAFKA